MRLSKNRRAPASDQQLLLGKNHLGRYGVCTLSVTIRDAQHLCWKNFRLINDKLDPESGKSWTPQVTVSELLRETGKIESAIANLPNSSSALESESTEDLSTSLSNLLYLSFVLAEHYRIELEDSFLQTVNDYMLKFVK